MNIIPFILMYFFVYKTILFNTVPSNYLLFKTLASTCFIICAFLSYKKSPATKKYSAILITGLLFGLAGDVFLSSSINNAFLLGAASFAAGHLLFIIGFSFISPIHIKDFLLSLIGSSIFIYFITHNESLELGNELPIACIYSFIILLMLTKACTLFKFRKINKFFTYFTIIGAFLFVLSDFILTFELFLTNAPKILNTLNLITYYSGQGIIALSLSNTNLSSSKNSHNA